MALIEIINLEKTYHTYGVETLALKNISFNVEKGEFVAIMGPSGSGKSTLLHILGFLDRPTGGEYRFDGKTIGEYSNDELAAVRNRKMGFIFQSFNLLPRMTVLENVKLPMMYAGVKESLRNEIAAGALAAVGLSHRLNYESSKLSGGEKQRVAIARSLVNDPQVIFADEPTGNLDTKSGQVIMDILQRLNSEKKYTVILITHETYTAECAERVIRILDGGIENDVKVIHRRLASDYFEK